MTELLLDMIYRPLFDRFDALGGNLFWAVVFFMNGSISFRLKFFIM